MDCVFDVDGAREPIIERQRVARDLLGDDEVLLERHTGIHARVGEVFDRVLGERPNQKDKLRPDVVVSADELLKKDGRKWVNPS